jgi:hypothetical protein
MTVAVDPEGVVEFTTRRRQLYRLDREGKVRMIASWPRDPGIPFSPPSCESHSLAVAPDGTRCLGDLVSGKIFLLEERADGTTDLRPVAGNGRYHAGEEEAPDAREAGVEPADLAFGAGGDLYYVESRNNSVKRLRRDGETWSLATALRSYRPSCPVFLDWPHGCGRIPFQLTTTPEGALFVLDPLEKILHDLKAKESHSLRTLPAQVWPILCEVTAIPGGLLFLCLNGSLFHLETSDPQASCFDLAMGALAAGRSGNRLAVPEARGKLARLMAGPPSRTREHFGTLDGGPSPLEVTALCEDLLFLTDDYLWNPWQAWSAQWALWHLEVP